MRTGATAATPSAIAAQLGKLAFLRALGADRFDLMSLPPNRVKLLAGLARHSTNQALARTPPLRRHPALLAFCAEAVAGLTDEVVDLFDRALGAAHARAANEKVVLFAAVARVLLDPDVDDEAVRAAVFARVPPERLAAAAAEAEALARPPPTTATSTSSRRATPTCASSPPGSWPPWTSARRRAVPGCSRRPRCCAGSTPRVVPATVRDATYVLDGILDNETELAMVEHTTDSHGHPDVVFALFDLLGLAFAPRLRDLADQRLYRLGPPQDLARFRRAGPLLRASVDERGIAERFDDLLRVAGSLKLGWVTASLLVSRLHAQRRRSALTRALVDYGRVAKTLFVLRYLESEEYRRRIGRQLNKGESLHALRRFLFFAEEGRVRRGHLEDQANQAACLTLVTNAVVAWNTVYVAAAVEQLRAEGRAVPDGTVARLSPALHDHVNPYGRYAFDVEGVLARPGLRPLRPPDGGA